MATSKRILSEQILRRLNSGDRSVGAKVHQLEIDKAVEQAINALLRPQYFDTLKGEGVEAEGFVVCSYDNIAVTSWRGVSKTTLPAIPANLPKNQGVQRLYNQNDVTSNAFIPATAGEMEMLKSQPLLSTLLGQIAYKIRGRDIIFSKDLTAQNPAITAISADLVVMDFSQFTDYDMLPINADMEAQVVETVFRMFAAEPVAPQTIDPTDDTK